MFAVPVENHTAMIFSKKNFKKRRGSRRGTGTGSFQGRQERKRTEQLSRASRLMHITEHKKKTHASHCLAWQKSPLSAAPPAKEAKNQMEIPGLARRMLDLEKIPTEQEQNEGRDVLAALCKKLGIKLDEAEAPPPTPGPKSGANDSSSDSSSDESAGPILRAVQELQAQVRVRDLQDSLQELRNEARIHWSADL